MLGGRPQARPVHKKLVVADHEGNESAQSKSPLFNCPACLQDFCSEGCVGVVEVAFDSDRKKKARCQTKFRINSGTGSFHEL